MNKAQFEDFDSFLAAAEVTGTRFGTDLLSNGCALGAYGMRHGLEEDIRVGNGAYDKISSLLGLPCENGDTCKEFDLLYLANDATNGDPKAVRAKLHELFPEFASIPVSPAVAVSSGPTQEDAP